MLNKQCQNTFAICSHLQHNITHVKTALKAKKPSKVGKMYKTILFEDSYQYSNSPNSLLIVSLVREDFSTHPTTWASIWKVSAI